MTDTIIYQVSLAILWFKKIRREQPAFTGKLTVDIEAKDLDSLQKYAQYVKCEVMPPNVYLQYFHVKRFIGDLTVVIKCKNN